MASQTKLARDAQINVLKSYAKSCKDSESKLSDLLNSSDGSSSDLMEIMTENKIRHVVIMEGKALLGIVSIGDVVKRLIEKLEGEAEQLRFFINS